jgi:ribokinase
MHDVITVGSAVVDVFIKSKQLVLRPTSKGTMICQAYGEKVDVEHFALVSGGGASNTAVGFARAGFCVAAVTETGKDTMSELIVSEFHRECVSTNFIAQERREQTGGSVILIGEDGGRTIMVHRGASSQLDPHDIPMRPLKLAKWVHVSSIAGRILTLRKIFAAVKEGKAGCSWNPGLAELQLLSEGQLKPETVPCQILLLNVQEWKKIRLVQRRCRDHIPEIVVTDGDKGGALYLKGNRRPIRFAAGGKQCVDATGAGDAFAVGYVTARMNQLEPESAVQWGVRNASSVIQHMGAKQGLLSRSGLENE